MKRILLSLLLCMAVVSMQAGWPEYYDEKKEIYVYPTDEPYLWYIGNPDQYTTIRIDNGSPIVNYITTKTSSLNGNKYYAYDISKYRDGKIHKITAAYRGIGTAVTYFIVTDISEGTLVDGINYTSTNTNHTLYLYSSSPKEWERSYDEGATWEKVSDSNSYKITDQSDTEKTVYYRILGEDGTYSKILKVAYMDIVPEVVKTLVDDRTKTVDESATFTLDIPEDDSYSYQWKHNGVAIEGATQSSYTISEIKHTDAGEYTCTVTNHVSESTSVGVTLTVNKCPQEITFPEFETKTYSDEPITLPEKTNKGLTIVYQSTNQNVATVSGNILTITGAGETQIIASQAGSNDYLAAETVTRKLTVNKIKQSIMFDEIPVKTYGNLPFTLPQTSDKGLTLKYTIVNTEVATLGSDGYTVTIQNAGTTDIVAAQDGDATHYAADPVTRTLTVNKATQTITFAPFDPKTYGDPAITLNAVSDKDLPITYTADNDVVSINGNIVTINKVGTSTITATQEGNRNFMPAAPVSQTITISKAFQTIAFGTIENRPYGSPDFTLPEKTDKGLTISYASDNEEVAVVTGNTVKVKNAGTCNITATQEGNEYYEPIAAVMQPFTVTKAYQTITFDELPTLTYGCAPVTLTASNDKGGDVYFESSDQSIATVSGNTMTIVGAGRCYITAKAAGNNNLYEATPVQRQLVVNKSTQTVTFDDLQDMTYGDADFTLGAQSSTGLDITYKSSNSAILSIEGNVAKIKGAGTVTITATQMGNGNYESSSITKSLRINKAQLVVKADNLTKLYGDAIPTLTLTYTGLVNGDTPQNLKALPKGTTTATQKSTVGMYDITVQATSDDNYSMSFQNGILTVAKAPLTITTDAKTREYGENNPTFTVTYTGFKLSDSANSLMQKPVITCDAKKTSDVGSYVIKADEAEASNYEISYEFNNLAITKAPLVARVTDESMNYGDEPVHKILYSGFKLNDDESVIDKAPRIVCNVTRETYPGTYEIYIEGGLDNNYSLRTDNTLHNVYVAKARLDVYMQDVTRAYGMPNPDFYKYLRFDGFKNNDQPSDLYQMPEISCSAKQNTWYGEYPIYLSGGYDPRYDMYLHNGVLYVVDIQKNNQEIIWKQDFANVSIGDVVRLTAKATSDLPVTYSIVKGKECVELSGDRLTIVKDGVIEIVAEQNGDDYYYAAVPVKKIVTILDTAISFLQIDDSETVSVFSISGNPVFKGQKSEMMQLSRGVYIVRHNGKSMKIRLK